MPVVQDLAVEHPMGATSILAPVAMGIALAALALAAAVDLRRRIIPDTAVLTVAGAGLLLRLLDFDGASFAVSAVLAVVLLAGLGQLARNGIVGGGDAKLIAASSFLQPPTEVPTLILHIALAGGGLALAYIARNQFYKLCSRVTANGAAQPFEPAPSLPYAIAVLGGVLTSRLLPCVP